MVKERFVKKEQLKNLPVTYTGSIYSPVQHEMIFETIESYLEDSGLKIKNESFLSGRKGQQIIGNYVLEHEGLELNPLLSFKNSLDGSMSFGVAGGMSVVSICSNGNVFGDLMMYSRRHTGNARNEIVENVKYACDKIITTVEKHIDISKKMKEIEVSKKVVSELCGQMFIEENILKATQLSIIKNEIDNSSFNYQSKGSLWEFYNHCTFALKGTHPFLWHKAHEEVGNFFLKTFSIA
jgi:hypothetical protein